MTLRDHVSAVTLTVAALLVAACGPEEARDPACPEGDPGLTLQVEPGDVLVSINGRAVRSRAEAVERMRTPDADAGPWRVVLDRGGERVEFNVDPTR